MQDEKIHPDGRRNQRELQIDEHDDIEPDGIEAKTRNQRKQDGERDENNGNGFQNAAQEEQQDIDGDKDRPFPEIKPGDIGRERLRRIQNGQDKAEKRRADHDGVDHAARLYGVVQNGRQVAKVQAAIDDKRDEKAVEDANGRRFRRGESAGVNAADDQDGKEEPPGRTFERRKPFAPRRRFLRLEIARGKYDDADEKKHHENPGDDAADEKFPDGFIRDGAVENHRNGRRNQNAERAAGRDGAENEPSIIAAGKHFRNGDGANRDGASDGRARDGRKDGACDDRRDAEAAGQMPQPLICELKEIVSHFPDEQNLAHEDIHRNGRQDEIIQRFIADNRQLRHRPFTAQIHRDTGHPGQRECKCDGQPGKEENQKQYRKCDNHAVSSFPKSCERSRSASCKMVPMTWSAMMPIPIGMEICGIQSGVESVVGAQLS